MLERPAALAAPQHMKKLFSPLAIAAVHALIQWHVMHGAVGPARDGARYFRYALRLDGEPWSAVIRTSVDHPGYPMLLHGAFRVARAIGAESPHALLLAAQLATSLCGLLFLLISHRVLRRLWGELVATVSVLCLAALPRPAYTFADVLSDPLHAFLCMTSLALLLRTSARAVREAPRAPKSGLWAAAAAGVVGAMAYCVRVDALTLPVAIVLAAAGTALAGGARQPLRARVIGAYAAGFAAGAAPFGVMIGGLSSKPVLGELFLRGGWVDAGAAWPFVAVTTMLPGAGILAAAGAVFRDLGQEVQWVHVATAGLSLPFFVRRGGARTGSTGSAAVAFAAAWFAVHTAAIVAVEWRHGYASSRYFLPVLPFLIAAGVEGARRASRWLRLEWKGRPLLVGAVVVASIAAALPSFLRSRLHESSAGGLAAGRWVAEHIGANDVVHDPAFFPSYLAGLAARVRPIEEDFSAPTRRLIIAEDSQVPQIPRLPPWIAGGKGRRIASFPRREGGSDLGAGVYEVGPNPP